MAIETIGIAHYIEIGSSSHLIILDKGGVK